MPDDTKPPFSEEERALLAQQFYDFAELYPDGPEAQKLRDQERKKALANAEASLQLSQHEQQLTRAGAHAARDTLHANGMDQNARTYTTFEARDRAAHTPPAHRAEPEK